MDAAVGAGCASLHAARADAGHVNALILCMYGEFARCCFLTAKTFAEHARHANRRVLVEDLIHASRREVADGGDGCLAHLRPLLAFLLQRGHLPNATKTASLISDEWMRRIFAHYDGVQRIVLSKQDTASALGEFLFQVLMNGQTLTEVTAAVADPSHMSANGDRDIDVNFSSADQHETVADLLDDATPCARDWNYLGRGVCACNVCTSVQSVRRTWNSPDFDTACANSPIDAHMRQFCNDLESRLTDIANEVHAAAQGADKEVL